MPENPQAATSSFSIEVRSEGERVRVRPIGDLDMLTVRELERRVTALGGPGAPDVLVDLASVRFIDSTGLRLLLHLHRRAQQEGWTLELAHGCDDVRRVFELTHTLELLPFPAASPPPA
jgi:anti-sigma B factor antagonist